MMRPDRHDRLDRFDAHIEIGVFEITSDVGNMRRASRLGKVPYRAGAFLWIGNLLRPTKAEAKQRNYSSPHAHRSIMRSSSLRWGGRYRCSNFHSLSGCLHPFLKASGAVRVRVVA